jgi:preprotein translocase subunit Sec61beta
VQRARLVRFYEQYDKDKVANVDSALTKYAGREDAMWAQLIGKYGPEPGTVAAAPTDASQPPPPSSSTSVAAPPIIDPMQRARLTRFYEQYDRDKLPNVDTALVKYAGREDVMWTMLTTKYGPEPPAPLGVGDSTAPPPPSSAVAHPSATTSTVVDPAQRARLVRFYEQYDKEKLANVDNALTKYAGREDAMWTMLVAKYGPEPGAVAATSTTNPLATAAPAGSATGAGSGGAVDPMQRARLVRFYEQYDREKLANVDTALTKYAGREDVMWEMLVAKYGPEPR